MLAHCFLYAPPWLQLRRAKIAPYAPCPCTTCRRPASRGTDCAKQQRLENRPRFRSDGDRQEGQSLRVFLSIRRPNLAEESPDPARPGGRGPVPLRERAEPAPGRLVGKASTA